ncbi:hypothetical protein VAE151_630019 [Vibrio aestuarianus]|uniref:Uncharacterized protein n=1 Tax=Vibrio aestuarianus TaxID=28171 RepID=A0ABN8TLF2_9VIBR|nr:hypothetical protein VAE063_1000021 [Vibrio aestuarianus]CAH8217637.1 hypothetical protein VIBAE_B10106 [Vibrio aestuarianus subsp. francensis]CAH8214410.1 hypothetical protein VAE308_1140022 [Vibrio aestuarianus]CAH8218963.1 hypothetical protein VAE055_420019 [Vibrio aestuarianus]CAH8219132.1 hypothetical protein VAE032_320019 [Vibrio aestuarianus]
MLNFNAYYLNHLHLSAANAQLSGEQRTGQAAALHRKTLYSTHSKTATR